MYSQVRFGAKFIALLLLLVCGHKVAFASGVHVKGLLNIDKSEVIACYLSSLKLRRFPHYKGDSKMPFDWVMKRSLCHDHSIPNELLSSLGQLLSFQAS